MRIWARVGWALVLWAAAWSVAPAQEADTGAEPGADGAAVWLISYEAIPSAQVALTLDAATWEQKAAVAQAAMTTISPGVIAAAGLDPAAIETEMTPGGFLLETNPSLQARGAMTAEQAERLAAALGYVYRQWSVLVSRPDENEGDTAFVTVAFPDGALTPEAAQAFFEAAAARDEGLGGGYTAFGDEMIFLNVRDAERQPYSGLEDVAFAARLGAAAGGFDGAALRIADAGYARAVFVGNDWDAAPDGEHYAVLLDDPAVMAKLDALRAEHTALVERLGAGFGWR